MAEKNKKTITNHIIYYIRKDYFILIVLLIAVLACLYMYESVQEYEDHCNEHWTKQMQRCNCGLTPQLNFTENYSIILPLQEVGIVR